MTTHRYAILTCDPGRFTGWALWDAESMELKAHGRTKFRGELRGSNRTKDLVERTMKEVRTAMRKHKLRIGIAYIEQPVAIPTAQGTKALRSGAIVKLMEYAAWLAGYLHRDGWTVEWIHPSWKRRTDMRKDSYWRMANDIRDPHMRDAIRMMSHIRNPQKEDRYGSP